jgi:DNA polymerase-1
MAYELVTTLTALKAYLKPLLDGETKVVAFDFETSPIDEWRGEKNAALDPHKADITGVSLSIAPGTGIYIPLLHQELRPAVPKRRASHYEAGGPCRLSH